VNQINASKFKEQCLALLDHLGPEGLIITKHGKPVARLIGSMKGKIRIKGDVLSTGIGWNAQS